jgi:hypothetical protein
MSSQSPLKAKPLRNAGDSVDEELHSWRRSRCVLFADKVQSDGAGMGMSTMFKKVNALPSSER